ncbi:MAG TPA: hypothetical protein DDW84_08210 [Phycisphaerales bacterium]|nr:MAG: hypothetical protein A2Y13_13155 [Planctomycetes bacterium GWC2_45_44]HBG78806.1 hypothetical protein [Phycisphaerales bacterium]HBR20313.1 hypothetical protein [Phycisphaerales bacterium]
MAEMRLRVITITSRKTATETPDSEFESDKSSPFPSRMVNYGMEADAYICPKKQMHDAPAFRSS